MPPHDRADAGHPRLDAVRRPGLAVRDQVGRLPRPGRRRRAGRSGPGPAASRTPRPISRGCCRRPAGSTPGRRSSTARSWPSTRTGDRISRSSRRSSASRASGGLVYQPFDLLYLDGRLLLNVPLEDRKRLLQSVLRDHPRVRFAAHRRGRGRGVLRGRPARTGWRASSPSSGAAATSRAGARTRGSSSRSGPSRSWSSAAGRRARATPAISARWRWATTTTASCGSPARSGRGSPARCARTCSRSCKPLVVDESALRPPPPKDYKGRWGGDLGAVTWVRPELVMRAELGGWTRDGVVRQAAYKGLEPGRDPTTVRRESAVATTERGPSRRGRGAGEADLGR